MGRVLLLCITALVALTAWAAVVATGVAASAPRIVSLQYYEDLEDGRRHNVDVKIKGDADSVSARIGNERSSGRESGHISQGGRGTIWFFRHRQFVREVRDQLVTTGVATVKVKAKGGGEVKRKVCTLRFEPDPMYGDYAGGDCRKP